MQNNHITSHQTLVPLSFLLPFLPIFLLTLPRFPIPVCVFFEKIRQQVGLQTDSSFCPHYLALFFGKLHGPDAQCAHVAQ